MEQAAKPPARGTLLVVDDDPMMLRAVERLLRERWEVAVARHPEEALNLLLGGRRFDAILCDMWMPAMTGMDLHQEIARTMPEQAARMVFASGGGLPSRLSNFTKTHPHIDKPFCAEDLEQILEAFLRPTRP